jgi:aryl-alcohol dehydrogenase-like predicted oxidoreductase
LTTKKDIGIGLALGTAQLGMKYGVANQIGYLNSEQALELIHTAWMHGISKFDTAQAYGKSEEVLGACLRQLDIKNPKIYSKYSPNVDHTDANLLSKLLDSSLEILGVETLAGLTLHREELLSLWNKSLGGILNGFKQDGRIQSIGISVYSTDLAIEALKKKDIDYIQIPTNVLDRRFEVARIAEIAAENGKHIQIRSIFLQGLILMDRARIPDGLGAVVPYLDMIDRLCKEYEISRIQLSIAYIRESFPNATLVLGAERVSQIEQNIDNYKLDIAEHIVHEVKTRFNNVPELLLNPSKWSK